MVDIGGLRVLGAADDLKQDNVAVCGNDVRVRCAPFRRPFWPVEDEIGGPRRLGELEGDGELLATGCVRNCRRGAVAVE